MHSPLHHIIVLKTSDAQYGAISSSSSFINSVLPIIGGIGMDHFGAGK